MAYAHNPADKTALMTANDAPSPNVASSSGAYNAASEAWHAFDHDASGFWDSSSGAHPKWLKFDFGSALYAVSSYDILGYVGEAPTDWVFQGSNNDADWVDLDTRSGISGWADDTVKSFSFTNTTAYRYYRLWVSASQHLYYCGIRELEMFQDDNVTLAPGPLEAAAGLSGATRVRIPASLEGSSGLAAAGIFNGYFVIPGPLGAIAGLSGAQLVALAGQPFGVASGLAVEMVAMPVAPDPLQAEGGLETAGIVLLPSLDGPTLYECVLTGADDGLEDLVLPISSFQGRFRSGDPSFLAVTVPGGDYAAAIAARSNGDLAVYIKKSAGEYSVRELIMTVDLEDIRTDEGELSQTITLSGHRTETPSPKTVVFDNAYYASTINGLRRYRCPPDLYLKPGDTVVIDGESFTADLITWAVSVEQCTMEIAEQ